MSIRTASFEVSYTTSLENATSKLQEDTHQVLIQEGATQRRAYYSWNFTEIAVTYGTLLAEIDGGTILGLKLSFYYNLSSDGKGIEIRGYTDDNPEIQTAAQIDGDTGTEALVTVGITSTQQKLVTVEFSYENNLFDDVLANIIGRDSVTFALIRDTAFATSAGSVEVGGLNLVSGGAEWRLATGSEVTAPPLLIVTYQIAEETHPVLDMRYTTADPTTAQNTPSNSLGGYLSPNPVYLSASISESINSTQTTIPVNTNNAPAAGLASVGPEVFSYSSITSTELRGVTRAIAPTASFPAGFDAYRIPERVYFLDTDRLFDTRPTSDLIQYRCVAIVNSDTASDFDIQDVFVGVAQNLLDNVQIRIGVESPSFDSHTGTADGGTGATLIVDAAFSSFADGFFDGAFVRFPTLDDSAIVSSFSGGNFTLSTSVASLASGIAFVVMPAPSQTIANDAAAPGLVSNRFTGFSENASGIDVQLSERGNTMEDNDLFYVWLRRSVTANVRSTDNTGAILVLRFRDV